MLLQMETSETTNGELEGKEDREAKEIKKESARSVRVFSLFLLSFSSIFPQFYVSSSYASFKFNKFNILFSVKWQRRKKKQVKRERVKTER